VLGQQVSVAGARAVAGRLAARYGEPLAVPVGSIVRAFPTAAAVAAAGPASLPMPAARAAALTGVAAAMADGRIAVDPGSDRDRTEADLVGLAGIGPWTAGYIRMRGLGDPDVFLPTDLGVRRALGATGAPEAIDSTREAWHPWCSYVVTHLWNLPHPITAAATTGRPGTPTGARPRRPLDGRPADSRADRPVPLSPGAADDKELLTL
jgi:AraC family transcriptional regulator of adaptative response / DNA-3-methyladenine glycosylase II